MKHRHFTTLIAILILCAIESRAQDYSIKVDQIAAEFTRADSGISNPVSIDKFTYRLDRNNTHVLLLIDYTDGELDWDHLADGPGPRTVSVPGLSFDPESSSIVFKDPAGAETVCAKVTTTGNIFGTHRHFTKTHDCFLTQEVTEEPVKGSDTKAKVLNVYFNVRN